MEFSSGQEFVLKRRPGAGDLERNDQAWVLVQQLPNSVRREIAYMVAASVTPDDPCLGIVR